MISGEPARRVRTLRLAAADEGLAQRGALLIEDAVHTASVPGGEGARLLVVRRLALGRIRPGQSAGSVALAIEQAIWRLGSAAVHGEDPAAPTQPVVYFRDRVDALACLALRLGAGRDANAWFWPLVVPGWRPELSASAGLRAVLTAALAAGPGGAAAVSLVEVLHRQGRLSPLLAALRADDGPALLAACGWLAVPDVFGAAGQPGGASPTASFAPRWRPLLARWLAEWGADDARTLWLAAVSLAGEQPGRLADPTLPRQARQALHALAPASPSRSDPPRTRMPHEPTPASSPTIADGKPGDSASDARVRAEAVAAAPAPRPGQAAVTTETGTQVAAAPAPAGADNPSASVWPDGAAPTRWGGLYLLLPALARLGLADLLAAQPALAAIALPQRILQAVARSLRIPAGDAALTPLAQARTPARIQAGAYPFVVPASWLSGLAEPGVRRVSRVTDRPGVRVLCDATGNLPLALWRGPAPEAIRALAGGPGVCARGSLLPCRSDLAFLLQAWVEALRRWLARYAGLHLREVADRPGRILATRTHLDVYFDREQVDIRIRRSGLDLDPGWLPWLGRVVAYHYTDSGIGLARS